MAFGHTDCDQIYSNYIRPILRKMHVEPIRVDTRQHRDDLNNYIIRMLKKSDIALADLTYARPSVYYEAGFAERQIPVIYTARKDHLSRAQADDRLRVHFDLEMKKIVYWLDLNDKTFAKRLRQRVNYLIDPLKQKMKNDSRIERDRRKFLALSIVDRCKIINKTFASKLKNKHFWVMPLRNIDISRAWSLDPAEVEIAAKIVDRKCVMCFILSAESITGKNIQYAFNHVNGSDMVKHLNQADKYEEHYYFCSLRKLPESRLTAIFPNARPLNELHSFMLIRKKTLYSKQRRVYLHLLSPIDSICDIQNEIDLLVSRHSNKKSNKSISIIRNEHGRGDGIRFT
jgi:nucleoside 2-deoxyribosyltransferase